MSLTPKKSVLVAVSGGVDSICLLHILASSNSNSYSRTKINSKTELKLNPLSNFLKYNPLSKIEAAYINHSQRSDTNLELQNIQDLCKRFGIKFNSASLNLPPSCSESLAREERYKALNLILKNRRLEHLATAHHADDVIETALINLIRGTGPKGLCSLQHHPSGIWRPFLHSRQQQDLNLPTITKQTLLDYAKQHNLTWHEDSTNQSNQYLRNRVRKKLSTSEPESKQRLLDLSSSTLNLTQQIDATLEDIILNLESREETYSILKFLQIPEDLQSYVIHNLLSKNCTEVSSRAVKDTLNFLNTKQTTKILQLKGAQILILPKKYFKFLPGVSSQIASPLKK